MFKKIITILITIIMTAAMYNYVYAKYTIEQYIHIAEVNIEKPKPKRRYNFKVYYTNIDTNSSMYTIVERILEGEKYEVEILEFEGFTFVYADADLSGIIEKNTIIKVYYKENK